MIKKIRYLIEYFQYLKNPLQALKFKFGLIDSCIIKIKNTDLNIELKNVTSLNKLMIQLPLTANTKYGELITYIKDIDNDEAIITIDDIRYINIFNKNFMENNKNNNYNICNEEYFSDDQWDMINFKNRYVIDIGANIADTTLYFAKEQAKVIGFEPVKHLYKLGLENISLNSDFNENIEFINKAVGGKRGKLDISSNTTKTYVNNEDRYQIDVITIQDILNDYNFPPDILKMDCEGCEFGIILNEDLTMFNDIIFEHHSKQMGKDYKPLIEKLEKDGFKINTYPVTTSKLKFDDIGIIHAFK